MYTIHMLVLCSPRRRVQVQCHSTCHHCHSPRGTPATPPRPPSLPFDASGWIPIAAMKAKPKLYVLPRPARFIYPIDRLYVAVLLLGSNIRERARHSDLRPIHPFLDPVARLHQAFKAHHAQSTTRTITQDTQPAPHPSQLSRYTDADDWTTAHDTELDQLEDQHAITWLAPDETPRGCLSPHCPQYDLQVHTRRIGEHITQEGTMLHTR